MNHRINERACERLARGILATKRLDKLGCDVRHAPELRAHAQAVAP